MLLKIASDREVMSRQPVAGVLKLLGWAALLVLCATLVALAGGGLRLSTIPPNPVAGQLLAAI